MLSDSHPLYDLLLAFHIVLAGISLVFFFLLSRPIDPTSVTQLRQRFPGSRNWWARGFHLMVMSGVGLLSAGDATQRSFHLWWVLGLVGYVAAAFALEARVLPLELRIAAVVHAEHPTGDELVAALQTYRRWASVAAGMVAVVVIVMITQPL